MGADVFLIFSTRVSKLWHAVEITRYILLALLPFLQLLNFIKIQLKYINYFPSIPVIAIALPQGGYVIGSGRGGDLLAWRIGREVCISMSFN